MLTSVVITLTEIIKTTNNNRNISSIDVQQVISWRAAQAARPHRICAAAARDCATRLEFPPPECTVSADMEQAFVCEHPLLDVPAERNRLNKLKFSKLPLRYRFQYWFWVLVLETGVARLQLSAALRPWGSEGKAPGCRYEHRTHVAFCDSQARARVRGSLYRPHCVVGVGGVCTN